MTERTPSAPITISASTSAPIGESEQDTVASLLQSGQAVSQMNGAVIEPAGERVQQVGAVKGVIGSAVPRRSLVPVIELEELAGLHVAGVDSGRGVADSGHIVANADRLQRFDGLRTDIDRGADLAQGRSGLENLRLDPDGLQRMRGRDPGEPAADDRYPTARRHQSLQTFAGINPGHVSPSMAGPCSSAPVRRGAANHEAKSADSQSRQTSAFAF